jgi:hypothetical protein
MIRFGRVLAVARRDLALVVRGRGGWLLPALMAGLLLPASSLGPPGSGVAPPTVSWVRGDVPDAVLALPDVKKTRADWAPEFSRPDPDGPVVVTASEIPDAIRPALDGPEPAVIVEDVRVIARVPRRSLLLGLIAASVLTGALSESIPGERARGTLETLLTAGITRTELVVGKWAAWAGIGAASAMLAAGVALLRGTLDLGWWLLPLPLVPACTVALGLFMVRRAPDVAGGSTVAMRALPGVLAVAMVLAFVVAGVHPLLGPAFPLGGALLTGGDLWPGLVPALVASGSTLATTIFCLGLTIRDLEADATDPTWFTRRGRAIFVGSTVATLAWWVPLVGPLLWAAAGNPNITDHLARGPGVVGAAALLLLLVAVEVGGAQEPWIALGGPRSPRWALSAVAIALVVGVVLAATSNTSALVPMPSSAFLAEARIRLAAGLAPTWSGPLALIVSILAQEIAFRGWLQRAAGPIAAVFVCTLVTSPFDPVHGLLCAGLLAGVAHRTGHIGGSIVAHLAWAALAGLTPWFPPGVSLAIGAVVLMALFADRDR